MDLYKNNIGSLGEQYWIITELIFGT